jgi:hypothetical protein
VSARLIDRDSFVLESIDHSMSKGGYFCLFAAGTVEVTFQGKTRRVAARRFSDNDIVCSEALTGRYITGKKAWPAVIWSRGGDGGESIRFGFDSRSGKHRKYALSWASEKGGGR